MTQTQTIQPPTDTSQDKSGAAAVMYESVADPCSGDSTSKVSPDTEAITSHLVTLRQQQDALLVELQQLKMERRVLTEMHDQRKALAEQFHEREVLGPLFRTLIGLADRCRQDVARLRTMQEDTIGKSRLDVSLPASCLLQARQADLVELETVLANLGVEPFHHPDERFCAQLQKCMKRMRTAKQAKHQFIAQRLLPGYRRGERIVRHECVSVFVFNQETPSNR